MKLTREASHYWSNVEPLRASQLQQPFETWAAMKDELKGQYMPPSDVARLLNQRHHFSQESLSVKDYVSKFNEFFICCRGLSTESDI